MKTSSAELVAHLNAGRAFKRAELWTFTLSDGTLVRYSTIDKDVEIDAVTWSADGPGLERPVSKLVAGLNVDSFTVTVHPRSTDLIAGVSWPVAARLGMLRYGRLLIERCYMPEWGDVSLGKLFVMGGRLGKVSGPPTELSIEVNSELELLNVEQPIDVFQSGCRHTLFDAECGLSKAAFKVSGVVLAGSTAVAVNTNLLQADEWFSLGQIAFTGGVHAGVTRFVKRYTGGAFTVVPPLPSAPAIGDTFDAYPGCARLAGTCETKFGNRDNFGAEPYVPLPETAL